MVEQFDFVINSELTLKITISVGGVSGCHSLDADSCIKLADQCMYNAKQQGRDRVVIRTCSHEDATVQIS